MVCQMWYQPDDGQVWGLGVLEASTSSLVGGAKSWSLSLQGPGVPKAGVSAHWSVGLRPRRFLGLCLFTDW